MGDPVRISKFLSKHLRHDPQGLGLVLGPGGWVEVEALLAACARMSRRRDGCGRHGRAVVLVVDAAAMRAAGAVFYCSENGVWLTEAVAPAYLRVLG